MSAPVIQSVEEEWPKFKATFKRVYETVEEETKRLEIFKNNLINIKEHNEKFNKGEVTYTKGINQFADLTPEEFKTRLGTRKP